MTPSRPESVELERNALFHDVWSRPCTQIAAGLGISSSVLKRICLAMDVPTPPAGHWAQVQFGKAMKKPVLPKEGPETKLKWQVYQANSLRQKCRKLLMHVQLLADFQRDEKIRRQQEEARRKREQEHRERVARFRARMDDQRKREDSALGMAIQAAEAWETSDLLRRYADAMEDKIKSSGEPCDKDSPAMRYLEWLRLRIHFMDPFAGAKNFHPASLAQAVPGILPRDDG